MHIKIIAVNKNYQQYQCSRCGGFGIFRVAGGCGECQDCEFKVLAIDDGHALHLQSRGFIFMTVEEDN